MMSQRASLCAMEAAWSVCKRNHSHKHKDFIKTTKLKKKMSDIVLCAYHPSRGHGDGLLGQPRLHLYFQI